MRKLLVFNLVTLDGYFAGPQGDISWHRVDDEFQELANQAANSGNTLLFGRVTYQLMVGYWPTPEALRTDPVVAAGMNAAEKIVFSRTLTSADWNNTRLCSGGMLEEVRTLKQGSGKDLTVLGSGSVVAQLADAGLVDEYQILVNPVVLGQGRTMFEGVKGPLSFNVSKTRVFKNGNVLLTCQPARQAT